jgi:hypothetical protein
MALLFFHLFILAGIFVSVTLLHAGKSPELFIYDEDEAQSWMRLIEIELVMSEDVDETYLRPVPQTDHLTIETIKMVRNTPMVKVYDWSRKRRFNVFIPRLMVIPMIVETPWGVQDITWRSNEPEYVLGYEGILAVLRYLNIPVDESSDRSVWQLRKEMSMRPKVHKATPLSVDEKQTRPYVVAA